MTKTSVLPERPNDLSDILNLMDIAFGPDRFRRTVYQFRDGVAPLKDHSYVARKDGVTVGSIRFWPILMPDGTTAPMLGPLAVMPHLRGLGIGQGLVRTGLQSLKDAGAPGVLIVGDPGYYAPFGFTVNPVRNLDLGGPVVPLTFMGLEYQPGVLSVQKGLLRPAHPNETSTLSNS